MTNKHLVEIVGRAGTGQTARLVIDGKDISSSAASLRLDIDTRAAHSLTVELVAFPIVAQLDGVRVFIDKETAEVLTWLGWTPPPEEEEADALD